jgi:hypothetical protein
VSCNRSPTVQGLDLSRQISGAPDNSSKSRLSPPRDAPLEPPPPSPRYARDLSRRRSTSTRIRWPRAPGRRGARRGEHGRRRRPGWEETTGAVGSWPGEEEADGLAPRRRSPRRGRRGGAPSPEEGLRRRPHPPPSSGLPLGTKRRKRRRVPALLIRPRHSPSAVLRLRSPG